MTHYSQASKLASSQASKPASYQATKPNGQAVLALVLLLGGIMVLVALGLAFFATSFVNSAYGFQAAQRAEAVAAAGVYDAMMMLARAGSGLTLSSSSVPIGSYTATVTVVQGSPAANEATITSYASVSQRQRTITAVAAIASSTGQVTLVSWQ